MAPVMEEVSSSSLLSSMSKLLKVVVVFWRLKRVPLDGKWEERGLSWFSLVSMALELALLSELVLVLVLAS